MNWTIIGAITAGVYLGWRIARASYKERLDSTLSATTESRQESECKDHRMEWLEEMVIEKVRESSKLRQELEQSKMESLGYRIRLEHGGNLNSNITSRN